MALVSRARISASRSATDTSTSRVAAIQWMRRLQCGFRYGLRRRMRRTYGLGNSKGAECRMAGSLNG